MKFPDGKLKAVTFSYDDNIMQNERLMQLFDQYGVKGTFNLNSMIFLPGIANCFSGDYQFLSVKKAKKIFSNNRHELATHGRNHRDLSGLPFVHQLADLRKDKDSLERLFGRRFTGHAYPFGHFNENTKRALQQVGIQYARTTRSTFDFLIPNDWYEWNPTCYHKDVEFMDCVERFITLQPEKTALLYIWGHAFEFDTDKNWGLMEEALKKLAVCNDIWFCTNGEFFDYCKQQN